VSIRPAAATDADAVTLTVLRAALFREMGQHPSAERQREFADLSTRAFKTSLAAGTCHAWLAEAESHRIVGSVALLIFPRLPSPVLLATGEGYLLNVYTDPAWRGQGIATALVAAAIAKAKDLGLARIRLHTTASGQAVYAAAGFRLRDDEMELQFQP
jgi:ribosomal protein S18 acetylase RimI-like enzyme